MTEEAAVAIVRASPSSAVLRDQAELIRRSARLGEPGLNVFTDLPTILDAARMLRNDQSAEDLGRVALAFHHRAWQAHAVTEAWALLVEQAEKVAGCTRLDLFADDEVPF